MNTSIRAILEHKGTDVETVEPDTPVLAAVQQMNARHIGSLLVTDGDELVGILTERDVLTRVVVDGRDPATTRVREIMTDQLVVIDHDTTVEEAMQIISDRRCRHLPVVHDGTLCGLVSAGDLNAWILRDQRFTIYELYDYVTR